MVVENLSMGDLLMVGLVYLKEHSLGWAIDWDFATGHVLDLALFQLNVEG
jgi:hypothetical protein